MGRRVLRRHRARRLPRGAPEAACGSSPSSLCSVVRSRCCPAVDADLALLVVVERGRARARFPPLRARGAGDRRPRRRPPRGVAGRARAAGARARPRVRRGDADAARGRDGARGARRNEWWWAAAAGYLAGLARPVGVFLAVFVAVEVATTIRRARQGTRGPGRRGARPGRGPVHLPVVGREPHRRGLFYALRIQENPQLRGKSTNPITNLGHATSELFSGDRFGSGLHALDRVAARRPARRARAATGRGRTPRTRPSTLAFALSACNLDSLERYALLDVPVPPRGRERACARSGNGSYGSAAAPGWSRLSVLVFTGVVRPVSASREAA